MTSDPIYVIIFTDTVPNLETMTYNLKNDRGEPLLWLIGEDLFHECHLQLGLHKSQQILSKRGGFDITFLVCVLRCGWKCGWNQVTDLLQEVNYRWAGDWSHYFELLHIQCIPLQKDLFDIIKTLVSETAWELPEFGEGNMILNLHFKRTWKVKFNTIESWPTRQRWLSSRTAESECWGRSERVKKQLRRSRSH